MPTYDYECDACQHKWEMFQSIKAEAEKKCPSCKKKKARRVIGPGAGIIFKGSGFYQTDYRSSAYQKAAEADQKSQTAGESKSNGDAKSSDSGSAKESSPAKESKPAATKSKD